MRVLVVAEETPWPATQGDRIRLGAILRTLGRDHQVTLAAVRGEPDPRFASMVWLPPGGRSPARAVLNPGLPLTVATRIHRKRQDAVAELSRAHDAILAYQLKATAWIRGVDPRRLVVDLTDSLGLYYSRRGGRFWTREASVAIALERFWAKRARVVVSSPVDRDFIDPDGSLGVLVARNGYDAPGSWTRTPEAGRLMAVGNWDYPPNRMGLNRFLSNLWPGLHQEVKPISLAVVGRGKPPFGGDPPPGVQWVGEVDDLGPQYATAWALIAPIDIGAGTKTKVLEALCYGVPVIATGVAAEGFDPLPQLLVGRDDAAFAAAIVSAIRRQDLIELALAEQARVAEAYAWNRVLAPLLALIREVAA